MVVPVECTGGNSNLTEEDIVGIPSRDYDELHNVKMTLTPQISDRFLQFVVEITHFQCELEVDSTVQRKLDADREEEIQ